MTNIISNIFGAIWRRFTHLFKRHTKPNMTDKVTWKADAPNKLETAAKTPTQTTFAASPKEVVVVKEQVQTTVFKPVAEPKASRFSIPKVHVPGLLRIKRSIAALLLIFNAIMSQFVLGWGQNAQVFALIFLGNTFILADYLWKTRKTQEAFKEKK